MIHQHHHHVLPLLHQKAPAPDVSNLLKEKARLLSELESAVEDLKQELEAETAARKAAQVGHHLFIILILSSVTIIFFIIHHHVLC